MNKPPSPELLAPAGNLEKLRVAYLYGADAAYIGTPIFGLRKYADNFNLDQLALATDLATRLGKKLYLAINAIAHQSDLPDVTYLLDAIRDLPLSAVIVADAGVAHLVRTRTAFPIHVSTQANVTSTQGALFWKDLGAKRVIFARELSIDQVSQIKQNTGLEAEIFIHGSRCAGYSGQCILSNYTSARDANRGGCVQNCRHEFRLYAPQNPNQAICQTQLLNTPDLMGIALLPQIIDARIDSVKIEGRMKSVLYIANTVRIYREAIDRYCDTHEDRNPIPPCHSREGGNPIKNNNWQQSVTQWESDLKKVTNRGFTTGYLDNQPSKIKEKKEFEADNSPESKLIGIIKDVLDNQKAILEIKNPFKLGDTLEYLDPLKGPISFKVTHLTDMQNIPLPKARINQLVIISINSEIHPNGVIRTS